MANNGRRSIKAKKGPTIGTGGHGRKALEGKGPTPKAEDRPYHKAHKSKQLSERSAAKRGTGARSAGASRTGPKGRATEEVVTGRNSVVEALRAGIPAKALHIAIRIEMDDRVKESLKLAAERGIPLLETGKPELDRMTDDAVHQGLVLQIPPYDYQDAYDLAEETVDKWKKGHVANAPLVRCPGRHHRSPQPRRHHPLRLRLQRPRRHRPRAPFRRRHGLGLEDQRRRCRAGPGGPAANLNSALKQFKGMGIFVLGLDGDGDVSLPDLTLATRTRMHRGGFRRQGPEPPGPRELRPDRLHPHRFGHGIAERLHGGGHLPVRGLAPARQK